MTRALRPYAAPRAVILLALVSSALLAACADSSDRSAGLTGPDSWGMAGPAKDAPAAPQGTEPSRFCLLLEDEGGGDLDAVAATYGLTILRRYGNGRLGLMEGVPDPTAMAADPRIEAFQLDGFTVLSSPVEITMTFFEGFWEEDIPTQDALAPLRLPSIHRRLRGEGVKVAVLDTGVDPDHTWLSSRLELLPEDGLSAGSREVAMGVDSDGDGLVDEAFGHGTHVAGIIAAVAPAATILPVRVLDSDGVGSAFELAMGLYEAVERGAQIINLSLVLQDETDVVEVVLHELESLGVLVVGAAGNRPGPAFFPARDSHVLGVAALAPGHLLAPFSAAEGTRLGAPGVSLLSAYPGGRSSVASGTSMACAVVSGAAALLTEALGSGSAAGELLRSTAIELPESEIDDGRIGLHRALEMLSGEGRGPQVRIEPGR